MGVRSATAKFSLRRQSTIRENYTAAGWWCFFSFGEGDLSTGLCRCIDRIDELVERRGYGVGFGALVGKLANLYVFSMFAGIFLSLLFHRLCQRSVDFFETRVDE